MKWRRNADGIIGVWFWCCCGRPARESCRCLECGGEAVEAFMAPLGYVVVEPGEDVVSGMDLVSDLDYVE